MTDCTNNFNQGRLLEEPGCFRVFYSLVRLIERRVLWLLAIFAMWSILSGSRSSRPMERCGYHWLRSSVENIMVIFCHTKAPTISLSPCFRFLRSPPMKHIALKRLVIRNARPRCVTIKKQSASLAMSVHSCVRFLSSLGELNTAFEMDAPKAGAPNTQRWATLKILHLWKWYETIFSAKESLIKSCRVPKLNFGSSASTRVIGGCVALIRPTFIIFWTWSEVPYGALRLRRTVFKSFFYSLVRP